MVNAKKIHPSWLARLTGGREASEAETTETARCDTAQWERERKLSPRSGLPNSIACYSLHRLVGNLRKTERIHLRFPIVISPARPGRRRFSGRFPAKCLMPGISPYGDWFPGTASATIQS
jgi:hypothetical protein